MIALYISGPMSGLPEYNRPAFDRAQEDLIQAGYVVLNPAQLEEPCPNPQWRHWMRAALELMLLAGGLAVLPDWNTSVGAKVEIDLARRLEMPIHPVEHWLAEAAEGAA